MAATLPSSRRVLDLPRCNAGGRRQDPITPSVGGVTRYVVRDNADDDTDDLRWQRQEFLAGTGALVLLGEAYRERTPDVLGHCGVAADLRVGVRVLRVVDAQADARVAADVQVLPATLRGRDDELVAL